MHTCKRFNHFFETSPDMEREARCNQRSLLPSYLNFHELTITFSLPCELLALERKVQRALTAETTAESADCGVLRRVLAAATENTDGNEYYRDYCRKRTKRNTSCVCKGLFFLGYFYSIQAWVEKYLVYFNAYLLAINIIFRITWK